MRDLNQTNFLIQSYRVFCSAIQVYFNEVHTNLQYFSKSQFQHYVLGLISNTRPTTQRGERTSDTEKGSDSVAVIYWQLKWETATNNSLQTTGTRQHDAADNRGETVEVPDKLAANK